MKLFDVVGNVLGVDPDSLNDQSNAQNTPRWDSLRHIEVIMAVENAFNVRFALAEIANLKNLGEMRDLVQAKGARTAREPARGAA